MADRDESQTPTTTSRRDFLKKSAAAGAVLWAAPTVVSSPAFGQTGGSPVPCDAPDVCTSGFESCGTSPNGRACVTANVNGTCDCVVLADITEVQCGQRAGTFVRCSETETVCAVPCENA